jgi:regulator of replication initiation timing|tara:strand:+ start:158 stop:490 length:333 start_codon:yes stop_codon:yes gene_type:complete
MNKTLTLSPAVLLSIVLSVIPAAGGIVWWVSDINTRLQVTEQAVSNVKETDTSALQERIATLETESKNLKLTDESLKTDIENVEHNVSMWAEKEFKKLYDIINQGNPLGQ